MSAKLCLSMIVKNEEKILARCLASVRPVLACYEICDTGSTDRTKDVINDVLSGILGTIHDVPFEDFSQARNAALKIARSSKEDFTHILLIDADMELVIQDLDAFLAEVEKGDASYVTQRSGALFYENVRALRRGVPARYRGRTHEYLDVTGKVVRASAAYMIDHACGSSRAEKYQRDERLLKKELEENPDDARSAFYLAQTYKDMGQIEQAQEWYGKRAAMRGWAEEVYVSHLYRGRLLRQLGRETEGLAAFEAAYEVNPMRAEALVALAKAHRERGRNELACLFAEGASAIPCPPEGALFVEMGDYEHGAYQELSIAGFYSKRQVRQAAGRDACFWLSTSRKASTYDRQLARRNSLHYARFASEVFPGSKSLPIQGLRTSPLYSPMNPSVCSDYEDRDGKVRTIVRTVNYTLDENGGYRIHNEDGIVRTENLYGSLDSETGLFEGCPMTDVSGSTTDKRSRIQGLEDMRLFRWRGREWALATTRDRENAGEFGTNEIVLTELEGSRIVRIHRLCPGTTRCEKNWVPLIHGGDLFILYSADPTRLLKVNPKSFETEEVKRSVPKHFALDHLRGGTQVIPSSRIPGGYVTLAHESIDGMGPARRYLHRLVWLGEDLEIAYVSEPFVFGEKGIEFAAGLARLPSGELLASYGVWDREARLLVFKEPS